MTTTSMRKLLALTWWIIFPLFTALVARTLYERVVLQPPDLWPWLWHRSVTALFVGLVYVSAHWWLLAWYLLAVRRTQRPLPAVADLVAECRPYAIQIIALGLVLAAEYSPVTIWRWLLR